jgi:hypothetical protein
MLFNFDLIRSFNKENREIENYNKRLIPYENQAKEFYFWKEWLSFLFKISIMIPHFIIIILVIAGVDIGLAPTLVIYYNSLIMDFKKYILLLRDHAFSLSKKSSEIECINDIATQGDK